MKFVGRSIPISIESLTVKDFNRDWLPLHTRLGIGKTAIFRTCASSLTEHLMMKRIMTIAKQDWGEEIEVFRQLGVQLSIVQYHDPSVMRENKNWPCERWRYHHAITMW